MNNNKDLEKFIAKYFDGLPRKVFRYGDKEALWSRVHNHILQTRVVQQKTRARHGFVFNFLFLRNTLSKAFAIILIVLSASGVVAGAARAMPGDTLYALKKYSEKVEIVLATSPQKEADVRVKVLGRRVAEIRYLVKENKQSEIVAETVSALKQATEKVVAIVEHEPQLTQQKEQVIGLALEQQEVLVSVNEAIKAEIRPAVNDAITQAKQLITKLQDTALVVPQGEVKGISSEDNLGSSASTTNPVVKLRTSKVKSSASSVHENLSADQDGVMQSGIQLDAMIRLEPNETNPNPEPTILTDYGMKE